MGGGSDNGASSERRPVPVTLLSGFLGAGKTTLLKSMLEQTHAAKDDVLKVAVLVNDMAEVNIDANLVSNTKLLQEEAKMVELHNGCICCTLREDLIKSLAELAADDGKFDAIVVESTGVSDPIEVAETFTTKVQGWEGDKPPKEWVDTWGPIAKALNGAMSLNEVAALDTCVTLVDAAGFDAYMATAAQLQERFKGSADEGDERSVGPLLMNQTEFADVIVLSKCDLISVEEADKVEHSVRALNPNAKVIRAVRGDVPLSSVLRTGLFDLAKASSSAGWQQMMSDKASSKPHVPETEEYGISNFVYKALTPFHPARFLEFLNKHFVVVLPELKQAGTNKWQIEEEDDKKMTAESGDAGSLGEAEREMRAQSATALMLKSFGNIIRSKGYFWLAGRDDLVGEWSQAGVIGEAKLGGMWSAALPAEYWPPKGSDRFAMLTKDFSGPVLKDRRQVSG